MNDCIIVTGGRTDRQTLREVLFRHRGACRIIAADRGLVACNRAGVMPDVIIGDFDSADKEMVDVYRKLAHEDEGVSFIELDTHKDVTDTHAAVEYAIESGAEDIYLLGATGTRLDHTLANIGLLRLCADKDVRAFIEDDHNIITMLKNGRDVYRIDGYDNISFLPYAGDVPKVTLTGFEYSTCDREFVCARSSLGVSNRIVSDKARIDFDRGYMLMIYSRD